MRRTRDAREEDEERERSRFFLELSRIADYRQAFRLMESGEDAGYKSNLGYFLRYFDVPDGASAWECGIYLELLRRLDQAGQLATGVLDRVGVALRAAIGDGRRR